MQKALAKKECSKRKMSMGDQQRVAISNINGPQMTLRRQLILKSFISKLFLLAEANSKIFL